MRRIWSAVAMCLAVVFAASACSSSGSGGGPASHSDLNDQINGSGTYAGIGLDPAQPRPSFMLTDTEGKPFAMSSTSGHPTFLYFGYTNCPDICPTTMADIRDALTKQPAALQEKTDVVFVTTDVKHDTGPVIAQWLKTFAEGTKANFVGLYGTQTQIDAAQAAAHVTVAEDDGQTHSAQVLLFGKDDYAHVAYGQSTNENELMAHDLPVVAK